MRDLTNPIAAGVGVSATKRSATRMLVQGTFLFLLLGGQVAVFFVLRSRPPREPSSLSPELTSAQAPPSALQQHPELPAAEARITYSDSKEEAVDEPAKIDPATKAPAVPQAKPTSLSVSVIPPDATVLLDGSPLSAGAGKPIQAGSHRLSVRAPGYAPTVVPFDVREGQAVNLGVELTPLPEPPVGAATPSAVAERAPDAPAPTPTVTVAQPSPATPARAAPVAEAASTPRVATGVQGDARKGKQVVRGGCSRCHSVSASRYSRAQWERFFASGRHDRYERLGEKVSAAELAAAKAYLMKHAADAEQDQGAGVR